MGTLVAWFGEMNGGQKSWVFLECAPFEARVATNLMAVFRAAARAVDKIIPADYPARLQLRPPGLQRAQHCRVAVVVRV